MLRPWFAHLKGELLEKRVGLLQSELDTLANRLARFLEKRRGQAQRRDEMTHAIAANGGNRIEQIKADIARLQSVKDERSRRAGQYDALAAAVGLPGAAEAGLFAGNSRAIEAGQAGCVAQRDDFQNRLTEAGVSLRELGRQYSDLTAGLEPLRRRRSNIPSQMLDLRDTLCAALRLAPDDLPRFAVRFKELLNENTICEIAGFQSQLKRERETIRERIATINGSLHAIDYNPTRYIALEAESNLDADLRDFQQDLRACTEGARTGSADEEYSEAKFLQVKRIIERFRGREGSAEMDRRWTRKVTDVRNWFVFSASERWREDDREHEHYTDAGGKSGGQKEKLAYTVLAASLAYQFGLEWGVIRSRSFRFVVIDEAFGRGSDESARYGLELFQRMNLQLLIVTPLQKIHIIEPYVAGLGFVHSEERRQSKLRYLSIDEYHAKRVARAA